MNMTSIVPLGLVVAGLVIAPHPTCPPVHDTSDWSTPVPIAPDAIPSSDWSLPLAEDFVRDSIGMGAPGLPGHASWLLTWDDTVDGVTTGHKHCRLHLRMTNGVISGTFDGPVLGRTRAASIVGDLVEINDAQVVTFRQDEGGYACVYAGRVDDREIVGTWFDTRGGQGDFRVNQPIEPAR